MSNDKYSMSFTTGGLFHRESVYLAALYLGPGSEPGLGSGLGHDPNPGPEPGSGPAPGSGPEPSSGPAPGSGPEPGSGPGDWNSVRDKVIAENLLQARTLNTLKRVCREIVSRLRTLSPSEVEFLVDGSHQEQAYLLWLAVCRRYRFIADFAVEVLRERYITLKSDLTHEDFDSFFNRKSEWHLELDKITPATRGKLRQVLFRILREADLLTTNNMIQAAMPGPRLLSLLQQGSRRDILLFPVFESDI